MRRFSALGRPAQALFLRALVTLPLVSLSLRLRGFHPTRTTLKRRLAHSLAQEDSESVDKQAALAARMVHAADRHGLVHPSCLAKSLTLWWLLGRQGITSRLRIGIRKENGELQAHAWVERKGTALDEPEELDRHYAAFDRELARLPEEERSAGE
ncbi:MAG: lasso peptide biosynthesis B2 protein [Acidobacteria bacterium Pan2503]|uniref:Lasso peptide biosynthesis B2 protein n=1 Tax=Candidatus Acidiferrum panamense TaxID=2741543 RepID=A0A7V8NUP0_9BACT|nr:lasso peptide biosynthesis B2 protein [Candidatus Acidoferrum panamensis]